MKTSLTILIFCVLSLKLIAQETIIYFKADDTKTNNQDSVNYFIKLGAKTDKSIPYRKFTKEGILREEGAVSNAISLSKEGTLTSYYPDGKTIKDRQQFSEGVPNGFKIHNFITGKLNYQINITSPNFKANTPVNESKINYIRCETPDGKITLSEGNGHFKAYNDSMRVEEEGDVRSGLPVNEWKGYRKGKLFYTEHYTTDGALIKGESYGTDGTTHTYLKRDVIPEFTGGIQAFIQYIGRTYIYPSSARERGISGRVIISFVIKTDGSLGDLKVIRSLSPDTDQEALRVLASSPKWKPGYQYGQAVKVAYTLPIVLNLAAQNPLNNSLKPTN